MAITPGGRVGDASPLGTKPGPRQLDDYVREVAHALMRDHGYSKSHAIAAAKNALKRWRRGGGGVRPQVRAGAAAALARQEMLDKRRGARTANLAAPAAPAREVVDLAVVRAARAEQARRLAQSGDVDLAYLGFGRLTSQLASKGARDPAALAAWIGRRKYGKRKFGKLGAAVRKGGKSTVAAKKRRAARMS